jgi:hypothetical protein
VLLGDKIANGGTTAPAVRASEQYDDSDGLEAQDSSCHRQWAQGIFTERTFEQARSARSSCMKGFIRLTFTRLATGMTDLSSAL